ncbi:hypothetical protein FGADI_7082 [Fusarium gaditjirri]|uniref:Enolase C-terminal domain-containing protein n=1 Tax=Fusarium gaditjirri TaxID=282569 RepID=A0A8H4T623_9HYPO|nr:hypothetical protein FGADI_7082 [Fusarium gaditjirri]
MPSSKTQLEVDDVTITSFTVTDIRFPTSLDGVGSDAMHVGTNGSHPCIQLYTNHGDLIGEGIVRPLAVDTFRILLMRNVVGKAMLGLTRNMGKTWRYMVSDSQYRWIGPEKIVTHLAVAGVLNAVWDLWGKTLGLPVWQIVCEMSPKEIVRCIDFRYITDVITPEEATSMLQKTAKGKEDRLKEVFDNVAVSAYTTSARWMAFSGYRMKEVLHEILAQGYKVFKFKVGTSIEADRERLSAVWSVPEAIEYMKHLMEIKPIFIEAIRKALKPYGVGVATGDAAQNRVTFKQLFQAEATDVAQIDAVRLGSVNECLAVMLMALKFNDPCVPHNGAMGLTELTSHLSTIDYVAISGRKSMLENADNHRENLRHPSKIVNTHYVTPLAPRYSTGYIDEALQKYTYPGGKFWTSEIGLKIIA